MKYTTVSCLELNENNINIFFPFPRPSPIIFQLSKVILLEIKSRKENSPQFFSNLLTLPGIPCPFIQFVHAFRPRLFKHMTYTRRNFSNGLPNQTTKTAVTTKKGHYYPAPKLDDYTYTSTKEKSKLPAKTKRTIVLNVGQMWRWWFLMLFRLMISVLLMKCIIFCHFLEN